MQFISRRKIVTRPMIEWLVLAVILLVFLKVIMGPAFFSATSYVGELGDANVFQWYIGWIWYALLHHQDVFVTPVFNYPHMTHIMEVTSVPMLGFLFGWLYSVVGLNAAFNLIFMMNYAMILIFGALSLQRLGINRYLSAIGGFLFMLMPYISSQELGHVNLYFVGFHFLAFYLLASHLTATRPLKWIEGALLGATIIAIFYTSMETCLSFFLFLGIMLIFIIIYNRLELWSRIKLSVTRSYMIGLCVPLILSIPGLANFFTDTSHKSLVSRGFVVNFVNDLLAFIIPTHIYQVHNTFSDSIVAKFTGNFSEWNGYLSVPAIIFIIICILLNRKQKSTQISASAFITILILSLGPALHISGKATHILLPWEFLSHLPLIQDVLPARLSLYMQFSAVVINTLGLQTLYEHYLSSRSWQSRIKFTAGLVSVGLVAIFWLPAIPLKTSTIAQSASIISQPTVSQTYFKGKRILFLQTPSNFPQYMGILSDAQIYDIKAPNLFGNSFADTVPASVLAHKLTLSDRDMNIYGEYLEAMLPDMHVDEIAFLSSNNQPIDKNLKSQVTSIMGNPIFEQKDLAVIWKVPSVIKTDKLAYQFDVLYTAVARYLQISNGAPVTVPDLVQRGMLPSYYIGSQDVNTTAFGSWIGTDANHDIIISMNANSLDAASILAKYHTNAFNSHTTTEHIEMFFHTDTLKTGAGLFQ
jgi:hypothetical protein